MNYRVAVVLLMVFAAVLFLAPAPAAAQQSCESLASLSLTNATITSATSVAAGGFRPPAGAGQPAPTANLPAFCRVAGVAKPSSDSEIKFEVWLPASDWNGKYQQVGNGGFAGTIPLSSMVQPLLRGYATAGTDDGHVASTDARWALGHPEKLIDFGYRGVHETSVQAKVIIHAFYGKDIARSYFVGCSDGGREALMEAQRFPDDFGGIVAGAPANYWSHLLVGAVWGEKALLDDPASYIPPDKLPVLQKAAVAACDNLDGVRDGLIEDPRQCHFDPAVVECKGSDGPGCLTAPQVEAARKIYDGPKNPRTEAPIFPGYSPGTEAVPANWRVWITGNGPGQQTLQAFFGNNFYSYMVFDNPKWDFHSFNFDSDVKTADDKTAAILNSADPDLRKFKARGGKLIQYHGWGDAAIPPQSSINYFESVQAAMGKKGRTPDFRATQDFYRLFMVPGMSHCGGGIGANVFGNGRSQETDAEHDVVSALDRWVEKGVAPDQIIATGWVEGDQAKGVAITRPLCPYPQEAHYKGAGDINDASNFVCQVPSKSSKK
ncbi:MAG TPA: tannase/feruloyl esterase family alpha/beta hydrolase [Candidatus Acidoferrales bacterium]|nr:tannase/feruloyl esterase family alpha/beta hydrolase [Candidatus Acidoferrales bacterium]